MHLSYLDIGIIIAYLILSLLIGLYYTRQAEKSTEDYFLGGRKISWWLAGTSMVATTFAADTPLLITELVANQGISGNWVWWNGLIGGMVATFFFAKLWHKANILTDVELTETRYSGKPAMFLRGFKAIYLGVLMNGIIIAWVNVALGAILTVFLEIPSEHLLYYYALAMLLVVVYTSLSGLTGVTVTDAVQFVIAMGGCIILAYLVVSSPKIGGLSGLAQKIPAESLQFFPSLSWSETAGSLGKNITLGFATFLSFVAVQWWASWYPGAEPGGGGYIAQRMMSTPKPQDALKATLLFQFAHHALRPWAWILVGLSSLILYPELSVQDKKLGYVMAMKEFLPDGLKGLLLVAFLAAYMSTIATQFNWGCSYVINDFYQRFVAPKATEKQLISASRVATFILMGISLLITSYIGTLEDAFKFMIKASAGLGGVLILRWYWWRINAWSEITATITPIIVMGILTQFKIPEPYPLFIITCITTFAWILVTYLTTPTAFETLALFCKKVQPTGFWQPIYTKLGEKQPDGNFGTLFFGVFSGIFFIYGFLFFLGAVLLGQTWWVYAIVCILGFLGLRKTLK